MIEVTYSLDEATVRRIRRTAERRGKTQTQIVHAAVADYTGRGSRLSEVERLRMLTVIDGIREAPPTRSREDTKAELREIRASRRRGFRPEIGPSPTA